MTKSYRPRHKWTPAEKEFLRAHYPDTDTATIAAKIGVQASQIHDAAAALGVRKSDAFLADFYQRSAARVQSEGKAHRFQPGQKPWNAGRSYQPGGRSAETRFQPKTHPQNFQPVGSERVKGGVRERKLTATGYPPRDWVPVHHIVWREAGRGDIPKSHALIFRDGNRENITIDNLELVTRAELMARNSVHRHGPELAKITQLRGAIARQINKRQKASHD